MDTPLLTLQTRELEAQSVRDTAGRCGHCPGPSEQPQGPGTLMHLPTAPERGEGRGPPGGAGVSARGPSRPSLPSGTDPLSRLPPDEAPVMSPPRPRRLRARKTRSSLRPGLVWGGQAGRRTLKQASGPKIKPIQSSWPGHFSVAWPFPEETEPDVRDTRQLITRTFGSEWRDHVMLSEAGTTARTSIRRK